MASSHVNENALYNLFLYIGREFYDYQKQFFKCIKIRYCSMNILS